jgi:hypothetical protein
LLAESFLLITAPGRQSDSIDGVEIGNRGIASGHAQLQTIPIEIDVARAILDVRNDQQASRNCNHVLR